MSKIGYWGRCTAKLPCQEHTTIFRLDHARARWQRDIWLTAPQVAWFEAVGVGRGQEKMNLLDERIIAKREPRTNTPKCTGIDTETQRHRHRDTETRHKQTWRTSSEGYPGGFMPLITRQYLVMFLPAKVLFLCINQSLWEFFFFFSLSILFHALPGPPSYKFQVRKDWVQCKKQVISIGSCGKTTFYFKKLRTTCLI